ncbi:MAG TPA: S1C family serine protease [Pirellulaceae bacterium]|nr:S1C family serine protease [Pirellulaceae bacterium]
MFAVPGIAQESHSPLSRGTLLAPKAFRAAAAKVQPSVVRIEGFGGLTAGAVGGGYQAPGEGPTTGLILSSDGYIVTSTFNFIRKPPVITVVLESGERHIANLLGRDETRRICVLKVGGVSDLPVPKIAPRSELKVGQWAVAIGVGFGGNQPALSTGIISATSRISTKAVQTDANTSPANYGGPLVDLDGRVIGICVPLSPGGKGDAAGSEWYDSGIGFAASLDGLESILDRLKAGETLKAGFLGVQVEPAGKPAEGKFESGVVVKEVLPDSPAAKAGLEKGDKLVSIAGAKILDPAHLVSLVGRHLSGDNVELDIQRGEESKKLEVTLADAPPPMPMMPPMPAAEGQPKDDEKPPPK